jgi:hypothetical protein
MKWSEGRIAHRLWGDPNSSEYPDILLSRRPPNWISGRQPANPIPLDEFVTRLFAGIPVPGKSAIKLSADAFSIWVGGETELMCPYEIARRYTDWAVSHACTEQLKADAIADGIRPKMRGARTLLTSLREPVEATSLQIVKVLKLAAVRTSHNKLLEPNLSGLQATSRVAQLLAELNAILPASIDEITEQSAAHAQTGAGDVWRVTFVSELGDAWVRMVGEAPTATGIFVEFVEAAWNSLEDPAPKEWSWERQIKTAIKHKGKGWRQTLGQIR